MNSNTTQPSFDVEDSYKGAVCGLDEVGRGPLAGPVVAACVYIPKSIRTDIFIQQLQDSKKLSKPKLLTARTWIEQHCIYGIGQCSPAEIDDLNILWASMEAMKRAYMQACNVFDGAFACALIDGNRIPPKMPCDTRAIVKGDSVSRSIAAASIVAKVERDRIMAELAIEYPHYGWERNAAYPTKEHKQALIHYGITPHHRKSFKTVKVLL